MPMRRSPFGKMSDFVIVWEFHIRTAKRRAFERAYGPDGDWATFFRTGKGFLGTELIRDEDNADRYLTLDFWKSRKLYEQFKHQNREMYESIDEKNKSLTTRESEVGQFSRRASKE
jgi:heme-degrading monooxygenase HmoA